MLDPPKVLNEMKALQCHFKSKRDYVLGRLKELGFKIRNVPDSTFYIWLDLSDLPEEINDGLNFFQRCLEEKVIGLLPNHTFPCIQICLSCRHLTYVIQLSQGYSSTSIPLNAEISSILLVIILYAYRTGQEWII